MSALTKEGAGQDVAGGLDGWMEMVLVDVVSGWRLSINLKESAPSIMHTNRASVHERHGVTETKQRAGAHLELLP